MGQIILQGAQDVALPAMDIDDLAVAIRAVYELGEDPGVSIGTTESGVDGQALVELYGGVESTHFGWVLFEADRLLKNLFVAKDTLTGATVDPGVSGYISLIDRYIARDDYQALIQAGWMNRKWFEPNQVTMARSDDGSAMVFDESSLKVLSEFQWGGRDGPVQESAEDDAFAAHLESRFDDFATSPGFLSHDRDPSSWLKTKQLLRVVAVVKWLKENNIPVDLSWVAKHSLDSSYDTPYLTPWGEAQRSRDGWTMEMWGGIDFYLQEGDNVAMPVSNAWARGAADAAISNRYTETDLGWSYSISGEARRASAISLAPSEKDGSTTIAQTDVDVPASGNVPLRLTRYYNSFDVTETEFGHAWRPLPYSITVPLPMKLYSFDGRNVMAYPELKFVRRGDGRTDVFWPVSLNGNGNPEYMRPASDERITMYENGSFAFVDDGQSKRIVSFDKDGRMTGTSDEDGNGMTVSYAGQHPSVFTHTDGSAIVLTYDAGGHIVAAQADNGRSAIYTYNGSGDLETVTVNGGVHTFSYDADHALVSETDSGGLLSVQTYDIYGRSTNRLVRTALAVDYDFSLAERRTTVVDSEGAAREVQYDADYRPAVIIDTLTNVTEFTYTDDLEGPSVVRDARANESIYTYNEAGQVRTFRDPNGGVYNFWYNEDGRLWGMRKPEGGTIAYGYDADGNLDMIYHDVNLVLGPDGEVSSFTYDEDNVTSIDHDAAGNPVSVELPGGAMRQLSYTGFGAPTRVANGSGQGIGLQYDVAGRPQVITNDLGGVVHLSYDAADNITRMETHAGATAYGYDRRGNLISVTDGNGNETHYEYDADNNLVSVMDAEDGITSYEYDAYGRLVKATLVNGTSTFYRYDSEGRLVELSCTSGDASASDEIAIDVQTQPNPVVVGASLSVTGTATSVGSGLPIDGTFTCSFAGETVTGSVDAGALTFDTTAPQLAGRRVLAIHVEDGASHQGSAVTTIDVVDDTPIPRSIIGGVEVTPNPVDINAPVSVSGTARYSDGGLVETGTVDLVVGTRTASASLSAGNFAVSIQAPGTGGTPVLTATISDTNALIGVASTSLTVLDGTEPRYTVSEFLICTNAIGENHDPVGVTNAFPLATNQIAVVAWIQLENVVGHHSVKWKLYRPNGEFLGLSQLAVPEREFNRVSGTFLLNAAAATLAGKWEVKLYVDGEYVESQHFIIGFEAIDYGINGQEFTTQDESVEVWVQFTNMFDTAKLRWMFRGEDGGMFDRYSEISPTSSIHRATVSVPIPDVLGGWPGRWTVTVRRQNGDDSYYIHPIVDGWGGKLFTFDVAEYPLLPPHVQVSHTPLQPTETEVVNIHVMAWDNNKMAGGTLYWTDSSSFTNSVGFDEEWFTNPMLNYWGGRVGFFPRFTGGETVSYWAVCSDRAGNTTTSDVGRFVVLPETVTVPFCPLGDSPCQPGSLISFGSGGSVTTLDSPVEYMFDWGNGEFSEWGGASNSVVWNLSGLYSVRAQARSVTNVNRISEWSSATNILVVAHGNSYLHVAPTSRLHDAYSPDLYELDVYANVPWQAFVDGEDDWISLSNDCGVTNGVLSYQLSPNYGSERGTTLRINGGGVEQEVHLIQDAFGPELKILPNTLMLNRVGSRSVSISVTANVPWSASVQTGTDWISISGSSTGVGKGQLNCVVATNEAVQRTGSISVTGGGLARVVLIQQMTSELTSQLWAWGHNDHGQLGDGSNLDFSSPVLIDSDKEWRVVSGGEWYSTAIKADGTLWSWGDNEFGQLGEPSTTVESRLTPERAEAEFDAWSTIDVGHNHAVSLKDDGSLWSCGRNSYGELGLGTKGAVFGINCVKEGTKWRQASAGGSHTLAIDEGGELWSWGYNAYGQLGLGDSAERLLPRRVPVSDGLACVSAGGYYSLGISSNGNLLGWGWNLHGQVGDGSTSNRLSPVVVDQSARWASVSAGWGHSLGLREDGSLWSWGRNAWGELGLGHQDGVLLPTRIGVETNWTAIAAGGLHSMALKRDGTLWTWGGNIFGQLGIGNNGGQTVPVQVGSSTNWVSISAGYDYSHAIRNTRGFATRSVGIYPSFRHLPQGGTESNQIQVLCESPWTATVDEGNSWLVITSTNASPAGGLLVYHASANTNLARIATITVLSAGEAETHTVVQDGVANYLIVGPSFRNHSSIAQSNSIDVAANCNWSTSVISGDSWITLKEISITNAGASLLNYSISENSTAYTRTGCVEIVGASITQEIAISQSPPHWSVEPSRGPRMGGNTVTISSGIRGGGDVVTSVQVGTNEAQIVEQGPTWVSVVIPPQEAGVRNITVNTTLLGGIHMEDAYRYNPRGMIKGHVPPNVLSARYKTLALQEGRIVTWDSNGKLDVPTNNTYVAVATSLNSSFAITRAGALVGWGAASCYENDFCYVDLAATREGWFGVRDDGSIDAWGSGPLQVPSPNDNFVAIAAGRDHVLGLKSDGSISTWGSNSRSQLDVPLPNNGFVAVAGGYESSMGLKSDGSILTWGDDLVATWQGVPIEIPEPNSNFVAIAAGHLHALGLKSDGRVIAWGNNGFGQLDVPLPNENFVAIAAGNYFSVALKLDGSIVAWGLGDNGETNVPSPNHGFDIGDAPITPAVLDSIGGEQVVINGVNLGSGTDVTNVTLCGQSVLSIDSQSSTQIVVTAASTAPCVGDVCVYSESYGQTIRSNIVTFANRMDLRVTPFISEEFMSGASWKMGARTNQTVTLAFAITNAGIDDVIINQINMTSSSSNVFSKHLKYDAFSLDDGTVVAPSSLSVGYNHALCLRSDGSVAAWGMNDYGQTNTPAFSDFRSVSAGRDHSIGLKSDGSVVCWGAGQQVSADGMSDWVNYGQSIEPIPNSCFVMVSAGSYHSLALCSDGSIVSWGGESLDGMSGMYGQTDVPEPNTGFIAVSAGDMHSLGLKNDGRIIAWGSEWSLGQLDVPEPNTNYIAISAGTQHSLALRSDGSVVLWGDDGGGLYTVPEPNEGFCAVAAGGMHSLALKTNGSVVAWGDNFYGALDVPEPNEDYVAIGAGDGYSCGLKSDGRIYVWGGVPHNFDYIHAIPSPNSEFGIDEWMLPVTLARGDSLKFDVSFSPLVEGSFLGSLEVETSDSEIGSLNVSITGVTYSTSSKSGVSLLGQSLGLYDFASQIGDGSDVTNVLVGGSVSEIVEQKTNAITFFLPACDMGLNDIVLMSESIGLIYLKDAFLCDEPGRIQGALRAGSLAAGGHHVLALRSDGRVAAWGLDDYDQVSARPSVPFIAVAAGEWHSIGLRSDGGVVCWGAGTSVTYDGVTDFVNCGQSMVPQEESEFIDVAAGAYHSLGVRPDGSIVAWGGSSIYGPEGDFDFGQLEVPPDSGFVGVAAGLTFSAGLKSDGSVVVWGQLGDELLGDVFVPPLNWEGVVAVSAGSSSRWLAGLKDDGRVVVAGALNIDVDGYLLDRCVAIAAGTDHLLALTDDGSVVGWGENGAGQIDVPLPNEDFVAIAAGDLFSCGMKSDGRVLLWGAAINGGSGVPDPNNFGLRRSAVVPSVGSARGGYTVSISGYNLGNGSDVTNVTLCGVPASEILTQSPTQLVIRAGASLPRIGDVEVYSENYGKTIATNSFSYAHKLSIYGEPSASIQPVETLSFVDGDLVSLAVSTPIIEGAKRYVCSGWMLEGNEPYFGETNSVTFAHTNDAVLSWLWSTQYWANIENRTPQWGELQGAASGWYTDGVSINPVASPRNYYHFARWTGTVNSVLSSLIVNMTAPHSVYAYFAPNLSTNNVPEYWLAQHGWSNDFSHAAMLDPDGDGAYTWEEYIALTSPTNKDDYFHVTGIASGSNDRPVMCWQSKSNRWYTVYRTRNLGGASWSNVFGIAGDGTIKCYTNAESETTPVFYRLGVEVSE